MEDSAIVTLYWQRSEQAIAESDTKYGPYCGHIAYGLLQNSEDTQECVSDTWLAAWNAMPPHRPAVLRLFLGKLTRRLSLQRLRRQGRLKRGGARQRWRWRSWATAFRWAAMPSRRWRAGS